MPKADRFLYCHCAYTRLVPAEAKADALKALIASGVPFDATADLCELAARKDPALPRLADLGAAAVIACRERAVRALFASAGAELPDRARVLDMRALDPAALAAAIGESAGREAAREIDRETDR